MVSTVVLGRGRRGRARLLRRRLCPSCDARPVQVVLEAERRSLLPKACPVDLNVRQDLANVLPRFLDRNTLDPIDGIHVGIARIAELADPLPGAAGAGVVAGDGRECREPENSSMRSAM